MEEPSKVIKGQTRVDRRREKLKIKLEKKYQAGKLSKEAYMEELHKIGYVTQQELLDDFKKMIREEIEYLENLDDENGTGEEGGAVPPPPGDARSLYGSELDEKPFTGPDPDQMPLDYGEDGSLPKPPPPPPPPPPPEDEDDEEFEEIPEEMAEWDFDEDDEEEDDDEDEYEDDEEEEEEEKEGPGKPFVDFVKVDQRSGVVDYSDIKMFDGSDAKVMDSYDTAAEVGSEKKQKKRKKRKRERPGKEEAPAEPEHELTEAEKLIMEMEADTEEEPLDLGEVLIPDMVSTMKSAGEDGSHKKVLAEIMWEADEEDRIWLQNKFLEEIEALKVRLVKRRETEAEAKAEALEQADIEDWDIVKVVSKVVKVKKGGRIRKVRREIWKVIVKDEGAMEKTKEEKKKDEREGIAEADKKEEKREKKKGREADSGLKTPDSGLVKKEEKKKDKAEKKSDKKIGKGKKKEDKKAEKKEEKQERKKDDKPKVEKGKEKAKGKKPGSKKKKSEVDWD